MNYRTFNSILNRVGKTIFFSKTNVFFKNNGLIVFFVNNELTSIDLYS